jgi:two-component system, NtrC family, sensor kinase
MEGLRKKLITVAILAIVSLIIQLWVYIYGINEFRADLKTLQDIHAFVENVLELRRYEKNFAYDIDEKDIAEVLEFVAYIQVSMASVENSPVVSKYRADLLLFKKNLTAYKELAVKAQNHRRADLKTMRYYGHQMLLFSKEVLNVNQTYITSSLHKILIIPAMAMFFFGGSLIVALVILTIATIKQIKFITRTTHRIAQGDFRSIKQTDAGYSTYPMIIKAFNRMIKELDYRQEQILQSKKLAAIGTLTSGIAHEVNNPLNNISLTAESLIEERGAMTDEEVEELLHDIISEVTRASGVVGNLLDFSRSHGQMVFVPVDIEVVVETTIKLIRNQIMLSNVQLKTEFSSEKYYINGDTDGLKQVFINLFLNALQAMQGGGKLILEIFSRDEKTVTVNVRDTGIGMPPEVMEKVFDPFFTTKSIGQGTGLGLSVVYGIVNKHNGYIEVSSKASEGTTFSVTFPRLTENESDE